MLAIAAIRSERLLREQLDPAAMTLSLHLPKEALRSCNISSIASASGFNRETTRRKVDQLIRMGALVREAGEIRFAPGFTQTVAFREIIISLLDDLRRTVNELLREGVLKLEK